MFDSIVAGVSNLWHGDDEEGHHRRREHERHEHEERERVEHQEMEGDGGGILGFVARTVRQGGDLAARGLRAAAPVVDRALTGVITTTEVAEDLQDLSRGVADHVDEDLRDAVEGPARHHAPEDPNLELEDPRRQADAERRARRLFDAVDGAGTDPAALRRALRGADAETIEAMRASYWRDHHREMDLDIDRDVSGELEDEAEQLLTGDPVQQAVAQIRGATHGMDSDPELLQAAIRALPADRRDEALADLGGREHVLEQLQRETPGADAQVALAMLENRDADAIAYRLDEQFHGGVLDQLAQAAGIDADLSGPDRESVYQILEHVPADRRDEVIESYGNITRSEGHRDDLHAAIDREMDEGAERERAHALARGDQVGADAAALELAADRPFYESEAVIGTALLFTPAAPLGALILVHAAANEAANGSLTATELTDVNTTDAEGLMRVMERRPNESDTQFDTRMNAVRQRYSEHYGHGDPEALNHMLRDELGEGLDLRRAQELAENGEMEWDTALAYATSRHALSTDEDMAIAALRQGEREGALDDDTRARLREELIDGPLSELDGRPALEVEEILDGPPDNDRERIDRLMNRLDYDRDTFGSGLIDLHSSAGRDYDRHGAELERMRSYLDSSGNVRPEHQVAFERLQRQLEGDESSYRTRQDETAEAAADAANTAVSLGIVATAAVITALTEGAGAPVLVAALAAAGGGSAGMGTRALVLGDAYEREDIAADGLRTVASSAGAAGTQALQLSGMGTNVLTRALTQAPSTGLTQMTDLALTEGDITGGDLARRGLLGTGEMLATGIGDTAEEGLRHTLGPGLGRRMLASAAGGTIENAIAAASDTETYEHGGAEAALRIGGRALRGGAQSGLTAVLEQGHEDHETREARRQFDENTRALAERGFGDDTVVEAGDRSARTRPAEPDLGAEVLARLDEQHGVDPPRAEPEAHAAAHAPDAGADADADFVNDPDEVMARFVPPSERAVENGSAGRPFRSFELNQPGQRVNWPANDGAADPWQRQRLAPGTAIHRVGGQGGTYFSPEETPIPQRSLAVRWDAEGAHPLDHTPEEHFYVVGDDGIEVDASHTGPAFNQPGGGVQYREGHVDPAPVRDLVAFGELVPQQANFAQPADAAEQAEIQQAVAEEEAEEAARRSRASRALAHYAD